MPRRIFGNRFALSSEKPREGGTSSVYKATDLDNPSNIVALKLFNATNFDNATIGEFYWRDVEALGLLKHPNIVSMIASDYEVSDGQYWIAMEWIDKTLPMYLKENPAASEGWDSFADMFVHPILEALTFAHNRKIIHRDIKPANILVQPDGTPKIADFGLSKFIDSLHIGMTVNAFGTKPYSPPERGTSSPKPTEDMFSLGVTILKCLVPHNFEISHENLDEAIDEADLPPAAETFVRKLVALNPQKRPVMAVTALSEFKKVLQVRPQEAKTREKYYLILTSKALDIMAKGMGLRNLDAVKQAILEDLDGNVAIYSRPEKTPGMGEFYYLAGRNWSYQLSLNGSGTAFDIKHILFEISPSRLDKDRENGSLLDAVFSLDTPPSSAKEAMSDLLHKVAQDAQERKIRDIEREEGLLFNNWRSILDAKTGAEAKNQHALTYLSRYIDDRKITFEMDNSVDEALIGTKRQITSNRTLVGVVTDVEGNSLTLELQQGRSNYVPENGILSTYNAGSSSAIKRQRDALFSVEHGTCARPELKSLLIHPETAFVPQELPDVNLFSDKFDEAKEAALKTALASTDLTVIQGPPGTGKTTWIAELVCQFAKSNPDKKILLSGQTHIAVDNALSKIKDLSPNLRLLRIGSGETTRKDLLLADQIIEWGKQVRERSRDYLQSWAQEHGISQSFLELNSKLEALAVAEQRSRVQTDKLNTLNSTLSEAVREATTSTQGALMCEAANRYISFAKEVALSLTSASTSSEFAKLTRSLERRVTSVEAHITTGKCDERQVSSSELLKLAYSVLEQSEGVLSAVRQAGRQGAPTSLKDAGDVYAETGLRLADNLDTASKDFEDAEIQVEADKVLRGLKSISNEAQHLRQQIADATNKPHLLTAKIEDVQKAVEEELSRVATVDVTYYHRLQAIQQEWLQRFGTGEGFDAALLSLANVVAGTCVGIASVQKIADIQFELVVIDEASKATPTEALVAMSQGHRWVLVGDQNQLPPFVEDALSDTNFLKDYDLNREDLEHTLFDRLIKDLPLECKAKLTTQHRMIPTIGNLISECFYDGELNSGRSDGGSSIWAEVMERPVTWYSTSKLQRKRETECVKVFETKK